MIKRPKSAYAYLVINAAEGPKIIGEITLKEGDNEGQYPEEIKTVLRIGGISNYSHNKPETPQYKRVGTALMEYALAESMAYEGCIVLGSTLDAKMFYEKCFFKEHVLNTDPNLLDGTETKKPHVLCTYLAKMSRY